MPLPELAVPPVPDSWQAWLETIPVWITGLSGGLLLLAGGRLYKLAVIAPGLAGGVAGALWIGEYASLAPQVVAVAALVLAIAGAVLCRMLERMAVAAIGVIAAAGVTQLAWPIVAEGAAAPWWGVLLGGAVGLLLFPGIFRSLIRWITALVGALMVAWSIGYQENVWVVGGLFLAGCIVQAASGAAKKRKKKDEDE
jgi:hypothetical protein